MRAPFDQETESFHDFVFGRIAKSRLGEAARAQAESDRDWQSLVALKIAPHPGLTPAQARAIALDYGMRGGSAVIKVRRALLFYALRRLGLDIPENARPPQQQHIVLLNRADVAAVAPAPEA